MLIGIENLPTQTIMKRNQKITHISNYKVASVIKISNTSSSVGLAAAFSSALGSLCCTTRIPPT